MVQTAADNVLSPSEFCNRVAAGVTAQIITDTHPAQQDDIHRLMARQYALSFALEYYRQHSGELATIEGDEKEIAEAIKAFVDDAVKKISPRVIQQLSKTRD